MLAVVQALDGASEERFRLGTAALQQGKYVIAAAALSKMEPSSQLKVDGLTEHDHYYLGLVADLSAAGVSARERASASLDRHVTVLARRAVMDAAIQFHMTQANYDTADSLRLLQAGNPGDATRNS